MNKRKNFYSLVAIAGFWAIAVASSVNKIHCGAFSYTPSNEIENEGRNYVLLNDGKKVYGDRIVWQTGLILRDMIKIDDEKFKIRDTRGYFSNGAYYGRLGGSYAKRIVHGKLNVYYTETMVTSTSTSSATGISRTTTRPSCTHYVQVGEDGELHPIADQKDIIKYVKDCPKSVDMIDKKNAQIRKAIRKNSNYLNNIFITYNNGCQ